jgi:hypothetical protein
LTRRAFSSGVTDFIAVLVTLLVFALLALAVKGAEKL